MSQPSLAVLAGMASTAIFVVSYLPMLVKAYRTKDLRSYSMGNLVIANVGNVVHSVYVFSLPVGPIWALHTFYLVSTAAMLVWALRFQRTTPPPAAVRSSTPVIPDISTCAGLREYSG